MRAARASIVGALVASFTFGCREPPRVEAPPTAAPARSIAPPATSERAPTSSSADHEAKALRLLALGDSFTAGTGSPPSAAFPARAAARLEARGTHVVVANLAVNGYTTRDLLDEELPEVAAFAPDVVTLAIGANDIVHGATLDGYRAALGAIFRGLASAGVGADRVIVLPQPDWSRSPAARSFGDPKKLRASIDAFNGALRDEAMRRGARALDLFPTMLEQAARGMVARDGLHPSAQAYDAWADELARALAPAPGPR